MLQEIIFPYDANQLNKFHLWLKWLVLFLKRVRTLK